MEYHNKGLFMALIFEVKVVPNSGKHYCILDKSGKLKCYVKSQAEQGKANNELIQLFAKKLRIAQQNIVIIAGHQSRTKRIKIDVALSYDRLLELLGIQQQINLFET